MTFAKQVRRELWETFGPTWTAHGVNYLMIALGLSLVAFIGWEVVEIAKEHIAASLQEMIK